MVETALRDVQLWDDVKDRLRRKATLLTLEQQQKLCLARLLPLKPRIILMDEPCSALDAEGIERIEELVDVLREKYTIVMVTHAIWDSSPHQPGVHLHALGADRRAWSDFGNISQSTRTGHGNVRDRPLRLERQRWEWTYVRAPATGNR